MSKKKKNCKNTKSIKTNRPYISLDELIRQQREDFISTMKSAPLKRIKDRRGNYKFI